MMDIYYVEDNGDISWAVKEFLGKYGYKEKLHQPVCLKTVRSVGL